MKPSYSYHIHHVNLSTGLNLPNLTDREQGNYLVFWWKSLALGHVFLEPNSDLSPPDLLQKICVAIGPSVEYYAKLNDLPNWPWRMWLHQEETEKWVNFLEVAFADMLQKEVPATVPVSVVVCTCNRAPQLAQCLERLLQLTCLPEEIIVIDNAPRDKSSQEVVEQFDGVVYVREPRVGLDIARNTGAKRASLPIVAYVDDDVTVHPLWVYHVWETFQNPAVAAMTGLVIASQLESEAQCIFEKHWSFNRGYVDKTYDGQYFKETLPKGPPVWEIGAGANMAFRKEVFEKVGYFDELLDAGAAGCNGDSEMWYRVLAKGHAIHYNPRAIVFHEHRENVQELKKQIFYYMRGHTVAALLQQKQVREAGYAMYLTKLFFIWFPKATVKGFPGYKFQHRTLWSEISGVAAGLAYYLRHKGKSTLQQNVS